MKIMKFNKSKKKEKENQNNLRCHWMKIKMKRIHYRCYFQIASSKIKIILFLMIIQ